MQKKLVIFGVACVGVLLLSTQASAQSYTLADVAVHNQGGDCWLVISGKVYNMSTFPSVHPGGRSSIIQYCGKDATTAFQTKGGGSGHSSMANAQLKNYFVGDLNVGGGATPNSGNTSTPPPPPPQATPVTAEPSADITSGGEMNNFISGDDEDDDMSIEDDDEDKDEDDDRSEEWSHDDDHDVSLEFHGEREGRDEHDD